MLIWLWFEPCSARDRVPFGEASKRWALCGALGSLSARVLIGRRCHRRVFFARREPLCVVHRDAARIMPFARLAEFSACANCEPVSSFPSLTIWTLGEEFFADTFRLRSVEWFGRPIAIILVARVRALDFGKCCVVFHLLGILERVHLHERQ